MQPVVAMQYALALVVCTCAVYGVWGMSTKVCTKAKNPGACSKGVTAGLLTALVVAMGVVYFMSRQRQAVAGVVGAGMAGAAGVVGLTDFDSLDYAGADAGDGDDFDIDALLNEELPSTTEIVENAVARRR